VFFKNLQSPVLELAIRLPRLLKDLLDLLVCIVCFTLNFFEHQSLHLLRRLLLGKPLLDLLLQSLEILLDPTFNVCLGTVESLFEFGSHTLLRYRYVQD